ncbi:MAG TPA: glycosyltransferase family protein [Candidatus Sulfotelmatobacter sp.]|nr:glycosyltransferase family protein [Candidatus Sulfotelmatobacter sp.]
MKTVAIIQARMGSTRLPGKVLKDLAGATVLARVVSRVRRARLIDDVLVATTDRPADDALVAECRKCSVAVSRGAQEDVLDRYYRAAQLVRAEIVVRITSDCPLIEPEITDKTIAAFLDARPDYASNALQRTYPRGLDTEVMSLDALARAWKEAQKPHEREHVTPYIYEHPEKFRTLSVPGNADYSSHRWTLDTPEDLEFLRAIYARLNNHTTFSWRQVLDVVDREPELMDLNRFVMQKAVHEG